MYAIHVGPFIRRNFTRFSNWQAMVLQKSFAENAYPKKATVQMLCQQLRLSESRVIVWFKNQRKNVNSRCGKYNQTSSTGEDFIIYMYTFVLYLSVLVYSCYCGPLFEIYYREVTK